MLSIIFNCFTPLTAPETVISLFVTKNWSGRVFMHQHISFPLCYPLNTGKGLVFLTCELPVNPLVPCLWTLDCPEMWASQTQQKRKERAQVEKTVQLSALHRIAGLKKTACMEAGKFDLSQNTTFPPIIRKILCRKNLMKKLRLALFQVLWQIRSSRTNLQWIQHFWWSCWDTLEVAQHGNMARNEKNPSTDLIRNSLGMRRGEQGGCAPTRTWFFKMAPNIMHTLMPPGG